jgi:hypothetical protein
MSAICTGSPVNASPPIAPLTFRDRRRAGAATVSSSEGVRRVQVKCLPRPSYSKIAPPSIPAKLSALRRWWRAPFEVERG